MTLMRKYKVYGIAQLYDKCNYDEWYDVCTFNNYHELIKCAVELYTKEQLDLQRKGLLRYVVFDLKKKDPAQIREYENIFNANDINIPLFVNDLINVLEMKHLKKNCLRIWGVPNSCKSIISFAICEKFICSYLSNHCSENEFYLSNCLNKSIILCEELFITPSTAEDFKGILSGKAIDVSKKFNEKQILSRTPVIVTSNYMYFGRSHLPAVDECALQLRCYNYHFKTAYEPLMLLDSDNFYHFVMKYK